MGAAGITSRCLSAMFRPQYPCRPHSIAEAHSVVDAIIATDGRLAGRLHPLIPALRHCRLRRLGIDLNITGVPENVLSEAAQLDAASTDPGRRPASRRAALFADDTDAARLHEPTDWSSRLPFLFLLPPTRRRYRLSLRQRRHASVDPGARRASNPNAARTPQLCRLDRTSTRPVHRRLGPSGHLCPTTSLGI